MNKIVCCSKLKPMKPRTIFSCDSISIDAHACNVVLYVPFCQISVSNESTIVKMFKTEQNGQKDKRKGKQWYETE